MNKTDTHNISEFLNVPKIINKKSSESMSGETPNDKNISSFKPSFRCTDCCLIPLLTLKENDTMISINCSNGHYKEMPISEYMERGFQTNISNIKCSDCGHELEVKKRFKFCSECSKILCKNCQKRHSNNQITSNHETISLKKMDTYCCLHKSKFIFYCQLCHKNICESCFYMHKNHQIISLKEIKMSKLEIKELKENIEKEKNTIDEIIIMFNNAINSMKKKFEEVINNKKIVLEFKKTIEEIYEGKDSNFQIIENINRIKFNNENLHVQQEMNELDILFEIFNYLNCIDYNVDMPISIVSNSNKSMSTPKNEFSDFRANQKPYINNGIETMNTNDNSNSGYIYEKKQKHFIENFVYNSNKKKEEEKNDDKKTKFESNAFNKNDTNTTESISTESKKDVYSNYSEAKNPSDLYRDFVNNNNNNFSENKNIKYYKKRIKERIIHKKPIRNNTTNNLIEKVNMAIDKNNNLDEGLPLLNEIDNKLINKTNNIIEINTNIFKKVEDSKVNDEISLNKENSVDTNKNSKINKIIHYFEEESDSCINNPSVSHFNLMEEKMSINNEKISTKTEKEKDAKALKKKKSKNDVTKSKSKEKLVKKKSKDESKSKGKKEKKEEKKVEKNEKEEKKEEKQVKEESDELRKRACGKLKDKSKEKRIKIKKNINKDKIKDDISQLNHSFDNILKGLDELRSNNFKDKNKYKKEEQYNFGDGFISERSEKHSKENVLNVKGGNKKNIKMVNKNYYKEKSKDKFDIFDKKIRNEEKKEYENEKEEKKEIKILDLKNKLNNIFYEIKSDYKNQNITDDDNLSNDISNDNTSNDISNDNTSNDISNDEMSVDNNKEAKIKKKKKKIIKKKKKVRKINVINDDSLDNIYKEKLIEIKKKVNKENKEENKQNTNLIKDDKNLKEEKIKNSIIQTKINIIDNNNNNNNEKDKIKEIFPINNTPSKNKESHTQEIMEINQSFDKKGAKMNMNINKNNIQIFPPSPPTKLEAKELFNEKNKTKKVKKTKIIKKKKKSDNLSKSVDNLTKKLKNKEKISPISFSEKKIQRSNSFDIINHVSEFETTKKINSMKFDIGISCLLEISRRVFAAGNLIGDIKIIEREEYKEVQTIREHNGTINSLFKLHDGAILSSSADKLMKKIRLSRNYLSYNVEFIFNVYNNYVFKGIELSNNKIISCSWDDKLFLWEEKDNKYINTLKFNENQRVNDLLEITKNKFCSVAENELKVWDSNNMAQLHSIKLKRGIISPSSLCKVNDEILISIFYNAIHIIDLIQFNLIGSINMDQANLSCITKLKDGSMLISEDINTDNYCIFYLKQYVLDGDELQYISYKKDKFYKANKNDDKEIRALIQFSDGIIAQGVAGEYNGKDSGDIIFYE